jgi:hypothetical protein
VFSSTINSIALSTIPYYFSKQLEYIGFSTSKFNEPDTSFQKLAKIEQVQDGSHGIVKHLNYHTLLFEEFGLFIDWSKIGEV